AFVGTALKASALHVGATLAAGPIRAGVAGLADRFIAGVDPATALVALRRLRHDGIAFAADLLGETTLGDDAADASAERYIDLIDQLADESRAWPDNPRLDADHLGPIPRANISVKASALAPGLDPAAPRHAVERLSRRVIPLLARAREREVAVTFDLEQWSIH